MPLYDCLLLVKESVKKQSVMDLVSRVGRRVYQKNGVITDMKSFGNVYLAYGIKKLDGRHFQGQLMQMTMMVPPSFHKELQYLNKEDRLLRWLVVKHRENAVYGVDFINEDEGMDELKMFRTGNLYGKVEGEEGDDDDDDDEDDEDYEEEEEEEEPELE
ncbi:uncharacterized protein M6B38_418185 [Iris pallida]|uniref:Ribosomal protein S6 n=1 Tax=Iris pallida TaxID=29817 RepID=A0AAX6FJK5_IRIPA|nr:uncharacterized protein M6B38_418185 [Iris pallida]